MSSPEEAGLWGPERGLYAFVGNYGSGKTEIALNTVLQGRKQGITPATIIDLDVINPYFRSREVEDELISRDVRLVSPKGKLRDADLPIITAEAKGAINENKGITILDIGGEDTGATVVRPYRQALNRPDTRLCLVVNTRRPFTADVDGILAAAERIEKRIGLPISHLVNNTNLIDETDITILTQGQHMVLQAASKMNKPLLFTAVLTDYLDKATSLIAGSPLFPIKRFMLPPWYEDVKRLSPIKDRRRKLII